MTTTTPNAPNAERLHADRVQRRLNLVQALVTDAERGDFLSDETARAMDLIMTLGRKTLPRAAMVWAAVHILLVLTNDDHPRLKRLAKILIHIDGEDAGVAERPVMSPEATLMQTLMNNGEKSAEPEEPDENTLAITALTERHLAALRAIHRGIELESASLSTATVRKLAGNAIMECNALATALVNKGVITKRDYFEALVEISEEERARYSLSIGVPL